MHPEVNKFGISDGHQMSLAGVLGLEVTVQ